MDRMLISTLPEAFHSRRVGELSFCLILDGGAIEKTKRTFTQRNVKREGGVQLLHCLTL